MSSSFCWLTFSEGKNDSFPCGISLITVSFKHFKEECKEHLTRKTSIKAMFELMSLKSIQQGIEKSFAIPNPDNSNLMDLMVCEQSAWKQPVLGLPQLISFKMKYTLFSHFLSEANLL